MDVSIPCEMLCYTYIAGSLVEIKRHVSLRLSIGVGIYAELFFQWKGDVSVDKEIFAVTSYE